MPTAGTKLTKTVTKQSSAVGSYIYQNPLMNPTNGIKNLGPSPILSTETFWPELDSLYDVIKKEKTVRDNNQFVLSKKPEGWNEFMVHNNFIESMFQNVRKEAESHFIGPNVKKETGETGVPTSENKDLNFSPLLAKFERTTARITQPRKLEAPWRNSSSFASPSALQQETFQIFKNMCVEPPKSLTQGERKVHISEDIPGRRSRPRKVEENVVVGYRMELPAVRKESELVTFTKSKSLPLSASKVTKPGVSVLKRGAERLEKKSPVNIQPMMSNSKTFQSLNYNTMSPFYQRPPSYHPKELLYDDKPPHVTHPMPISKRKEYFPQNQPTLYHSIHYGNGKRITPQILPEMKVKSVFAPKKDIKLGFHEELAKELRKSNTKRGKPITRKIRPVMLFPYHVPGPQHDNIYISDYHGSDTEEEQENNENDEAVQD